MSTTFSAMNYQVIPPNSSNVPILVSVPHCGTSFPAEIKDQYKPQAIHEQDDTDWFVHLLYDFAPGMGVTMIHAVHSRWVIDLNRDPDSKPLYNDGRIITGLCPTTDFLGRSIYNNERSEVDKAEVDRRLNDYYWPYHSKIQELLNGLKKEFGMVLLWDCHSIRQVVPTIRKEEFPDLILGDADGTSASPGIIETALGVLDHSSYSVSHNHPFKGGTITRKFGRPTDNQHALQLEMAKVRYMDDTERSYNKPRAEKMRGVLKKVFEKLIDELI